MKRLVFIFAFLILCAAVQANARGIMTMCGAGTGAACTTPTGDELSEGFEATGFDSSGWTEDYEGNMDADYNCSGLGSPPDGVCTYCLRSDSTATLQISRWDRGSAISDGTTTNIVVPMYIASSPTVDNWGNVGLVAWTGGNGITTSPVVQLLLQNSGGTLKLRAYDGTAGSPCDIPSSGSLPTGEWITVTIHLNATANASTIGYGAQSCTFTRGSNDGRYLWMGTYNIAGTEDVDVSYGYVTINTP